MPNEAHIRIDEGVLRGPRPKRKPSDIERQARDEAGQFLTRYTPEAKQAAIDEALTALEAGGRIEAVAVKHGIPTSTMYSWMIGTAASALRTQFFDGQTTRNLIEIRHSATPLELARAREELNGWLKVAAVRDSSNYGPKQEVTVSIQPVLTINTQPAPGRIIDAEIVAETTNGAVLQRSTISKPTE